MSTEDRTADGALFAEMYPGLRRFAGVVRPDEVDADDLVQEALTRTLATGRLADLRDAGAYLRAAIVRLASNHRRSFGRERRAMARLAPETVEEPAYPSDLSELRRLPVADRAVLYLRVVDGWDYAAIAVVLDATEQAVRARASRALRRLRVALDAEIEEVRDA
jgi:DNA-directed RNA polymerase specialized sigma24 family protein